MRKYWYFCAERSKLFIVYNNNQENTGDQIMKKLIAVAFGLCLLGGVAKAQTLESKFGLDSIKTLENASIYSEFVKQKNFKDALPAWRYIFNNAPAFQVSTYTRGEDIMIHMFTQSKNPAYLDTLMMVYDQWIKYFGNHPRLGEGYVLGKKGVALANLGEKTDENSKKSFTYLEKSFEIEGAKAHPVVVQNMFFAAGNLLKKDLLTKDEYINLYQKVTAYAENGEKNPSPRVKPEVYKDVKDRVVAMFFDAGVADCETLNQLLSKQYEAAKDDVDNLKKIASLLRRSECTDLPLYASVAEQLYKIDPSAEAAYSLSMMFMKRQDFDKMISYLQEAIDKSEDDIQKADYYVRMADVKLRQKQYQAVKTNALQAIKLNPKLGQPYIMIAQAYAYSSKDYGEDDFDHAAVFLAAVDKLQRAKQVDPNLAGQVNELIANYTQHFPDKSEAFFRGITEGGKITLGSWINETTTARFRPTK